MPEPIDELVREIKALRGQVSGVKEELQHKKKLFVTIDKSFQAFHTHILMVQEIVTKDFEAYTGIEAAKAPLLVPSRLATNAKKAVKRWPDPIKQNATKATSAGQIGRASCRERVFLRV
jgi:hypothetical protein